MKEELKFCIRIPGPQCVMIDGMIMMQAQCVDN